ncbi:5264_t:CDS:2 [Funneliformis caledonium]|uniref:5264_t:CDS:1 n=1 Tax=Funneliformis caledonium TaxID=1117310 RepID=A0A9N9GDI0_9GLOM|nr:5264_t:CDS:2 [Funneliformis caledonium]
MEVDKNYNENECILVNTHNNVLGIELLEYNGQLPIINTPINLEVGVSFLSPKIADHYIEQYAMQQYFIIFKAKFEVHSDKTFRKRVFKCNVEGYCKQKLFDLAVGSSKKKGSKKIGCEWQINMTSPKNLSLVTITLFKNTYCHDIFIETLKFTPIYRLFTSEIMEEIEFYIVNGRCDASTIWNLLQPKYPEQVFLTQDLICLEVTNIQPKIFVTDVNLAMLAASSIKSLTEEVFNRRSHDLIDKYPEGKKYISDQLLDKKHMWKAVQSSFSLFQVQEIIEQRLETENINNKYSIWKASNMVYPQPFIQMCESVCYKAFQVNLNKIFTFDDDVFEPLVIESQESEIPTPLQANEVDDDHQFVDCLDLSNEAFVNANKGESNQSNIQHFEWRYTCNNNLQVNEDQKKIRNQLKYGTLMGEAKKTIQYAIQDEDDKLLYFIKNYNIQKEQNYESSRSELNNENQTIITSEGNWILFKRLKSAVEKHSKTSQKPLEELTNNENQKW